MTKDVLMSAADFERLADVLFWSGFWLGFVLALAVVYLVAEWFALRRVR